MKTEVILALAQSSGWDVLDTWDDSDGFLTRLKLFADHVENLVVDRERTLYIQQCNNLDECDTRYRYDYRRGVLDCVNLIASRRMDD